MAGSGSIANRILFFSFCEGRSFLDVNMYICIYLNNSLNML